MCRPGRPATPLAWRQAIRFVAIDMSPSYRAAVRTGLPHATVVADHWMWNPLMDQDPIGQALLV